jgi:sigma-B regulation protein RsbU (phosphoserine phosphatase)
VDTTCADPARILIADDQPDLLESLRLLLNAEGFDLRTVSGPDAVLEAVARDRYDLLLMDLNYTRDTTSGREGLDLLPRIQQVDATLPVVVMTGWGSVEVAVEAMRASARDFVQKPWDNAQLVSLLRREVARGRDERRRLHRAERELEEARLTQQRLLPRDVPEVPGCRISAAWQPAAGVAGDSFDAIPFDGHRLGLTIADVIGKGLPAALLMSSLQSCVKALAAPDVPPRTLCADVNRALCGRMGDGKFISFCYGLLDAEARTLTYANAGHNAPILVRADGALERLTEGGMPLGLFADAPYDQATVEIRTGDRLVMFTDGITEARDAGGEEFGDDRLIALVDAGRRRSAEELQADITAAVARFCEGRFHDDATLIVIAAE